MPRWIGLRLLVAGTGDVAGARTEPVFPHAAPLVEKVLSPLRFGELPNIFRLPIWGAKSHSEIAEFLAANNPPAPPVR
jgi:hypothetical protein